MSIYRFTICHYSFDHRKRRLEPDRSTWTPIRIQVEPIYGIMEDTTDESNDSQDNNLKKINAPPDNL